MPLFLIYILMMIFLLAFRIRYFLACLLRWEILDVHVKKDYSYTPTVSVLIPCFNEGKTVYDTIESLSRSEYPLEKFEIVCVDDCSVDDSHQWMLKAQRDFPNVVLGQNEVNSKKPRTICKALSLSKGEICIEVDSDCIVAPNTVRELVSCFAEPKIGGVGGIVHVKNTNQNTLTMIQTLAYYMQFHLTKPLENWARTVSCISGALLAVRRDLLEQIDPLIRERRWCGIPVSEGEDRFLTHQILLHGYGTYVNPAAKCWTAVPTTFKMLFNQQLRWRRGSMRNFFMVMRQLPMGVHKLHPNAVYTLVMPPMAGITAAIVLLTVPLTSVAFWIAPMTLVLCTAFAGLFDILTRRFTPDQKVSEPWRLAAIAVWTVVNVLLTILALCTFDLGADWGTRAKVATKPQGELA